jgi:hypothetical protein
MLAPLVQENEERDTYIKSRPRYNSIKNKQELKQSGQRPNIAGIAEKDPEGQQHIATLLHHHLFSPHHAA